MEVLWAPLSWDIAPFHIAFMLLLAEGFAEDALSLRAVSPHEFLACFSEAHPFPVSGRRLGFRNDYIARIRTQAFALLTRSAVAPPDKTVSLGSSCFLLQSFVF